MKYEIPRRYAFYGLKDKYIEGKIRNGGTSFVIRNLNYGTVEEINQREYLEQIIMKEKTEKFHQTEGPSPLLDYPRLYRDLKQYVNGPSVPTVLYETHQCPYCCHLT